MVKQLTPILNRWTSEIIFQADGTIKEVAEKAVSEGISLFGANMHRANMSGANMRGADMSRADMSGADMSRADMRGANMSRADMRWANMRGADMSWADMSRADMSWANMHRADMSRADMRGANMSGAIIASSAFDENILDANWGIPVDVHSAFILLSLKLEVPHELAVEMLTTPGFCWNEAKAYMDKDPEFFKKLKTAWPEVYEKLGGE